MGKLKGLILFDFDGVLVNTWQVLISILLQISHQQGIDHQLNLTQAIKIAQAHQSIIVSIWHLMNELNIPILKRIKILKLVNREFNRLVKMGSNYHQLRWELFPQVKSTLIKLHQQGFSLAVVSEHKLSRLTQFLKERKIIQYFDLGIFSSKQKEKILRQIVAQHPDQKIYYLADKVSDVLAAQRVGIIPISITTGLSSKKELKKVNPQRVIGSLEQSILNKVI